MATKDWKKYRNLWEHKKTHKQLVIRNLSLNIPKIKYTRYDILIWHRGRVVYESPDFKTKQQALAYARAYMRKH